MTSRAVAAVLLLLPLDVLAGANRWTTSRAAATTDVDVARSEPSTAYATTDAGVFRTDDAGRTWTLVNAIASGTHVAVSPATPDTAYVLNSGALVKTSDRGASWKVVNPNRGSALAIAPSDVKTLYAAFGSGLQKSTDAGDTWQSVSSRLFLGYYPGFFAASSIAVDPSNASNVWMADFDGIAKTTSGGEFWDFVTWNETGVSGLTIANPSTLFGGRHTTGVIKSNDDGASWSVAGLSNKHVNTLAMSGVSLYAGTDDGRIYRSDDGGATWIGFDDGINFGAVNRIVVGGDHLYAATISGVFDYEIADQDVVPLRLPEDALRAPGFVDAIVRSSVTNAALVVPVAGTVRGAGLTLFTTELMLSNAHDAPQTVVISWLPRGGDGALASFKLTVPGASDPSGGTLKFRDVGARFGMDGIGSLMIAAVDAAGNFDASASIDASTVVWSDSGDGRAPLSQVIPVARAALLGNHGRALASGLRQDAQFRTNAGIVNLTTQPHRFTIQIEGERSPAQFTIDVPPLSMVQNPLPAGDYGSLTLDVVADSADARWLLYGSSIDRTTGEAQTSVASPSS